MSNSFVESILQLVAIDAISEDNAYSLIKAHQSVTGDQSKDIAIIGISCRFPQAGNKEEFWHNVASGMNSIRPFPSARMESIRPFLGEDDSGGPYYQAGYLDEIDFFRCGILQYSSRGSPIYGPAAADFYGDGL
ncbi:beta-ketoacyl synthase N-terminal-like domain-containing protein [Paenibacillus rhizoplanae]|uniref:beta-ketoacyl synthase N-terminal-like domain-containing protein n=1 Tax=Paenibacillus rhizoplanae TaxID=1917181 RepID=UPI00361060BA